MSCLGFLAQQNSVSTHIHEYRAHILRDHIIPSLQISTGSCHSADRQSATGADAQLHHGMLPGGNGKAGNIGHDLVLHHDRRGLFLHGKNILADCHLLYTFHRVGSSTVTDDIHLGFKAGIADGQSHQKTVQLGMGQKLSAGCTHMVLGSDDQEGLFQRMYLAIYRHLPLFHSFKQGRLGLGGGAVDLIR